MNEAVRAKVAAGVAVLLVGGAVWRGAIALQHYRMAQGIVGDPSERELSQASALLELAIAVILLAHAGAAWYFMRHPIRIQGSAAFIVAAVAFVLTLGSLTRFPVLQVPGVASTVFFLTAAGAGYWSDHPWVSAYLGAAFGSLLGASVLGLRAEPLAVLGVVVPFVISAFVGVAFGSFIRRMRPAQPSA